MSFIQTIFKILTKYGNFYAEGVRNTLIISLLAVCIGTILGALMALARMSRLRPLRWLATAYIEFFRGTPLMVQLFIVYFATPQVFGYQIPAMNAVVITFGLNSAAYISEVLRGGIQSIDIGQREAAMALGVPYRPMMFDIVIPQALKTVLPALVNELIALLKETSIVATIGMLVIISATVFIPYHHLSLL